MPYALRVFQVLVWHPIQSVLCIELPQTQRGEALYQSLLLYLNDPINQTTADWACDCYQIGGSMMLIEEGQQQVMNVLGSFVVLHQPTTTTTTT
jgi:hypothetical protein